MAMNGSTGAYAGGMIRFWNLNEFKSVADEIPGNVPANAAVIQAAYRNSIKGTESYFVFADFLHESQLYAIDLSLSQDGINCVIVLDGSDPIAVADTFSQFVELYITAPARLRLSVD